MEDNKIIVNDGLENISKKTLSNGSNDNTMKNDKIMVEEIVKTNHVNNNNINNNNINNNNVNSITSGWSWAGSFLTMITLIATKNWGLFALYIVSFLIPFINFFAFLFWLIFGGLKGKTWIYDSDNFCNKDEKIGAMKALESAGLFMFIIMIVILLGFLLLGTLIVGFISSLGNM